ncbi:AMP-binding enzyme domain-containing protein [Phthorimaea operculella]|nr:AMP-binding enzyme domain-containing protein [Phthorimaea operculella]
MDVMSETQGNATSLYELLIKYGNKVNYNDFRASDIDPEENAAVLMPTSGSTGLPKQACLTHKNCVVSLAGFWCREKTFPTPFKTILIMAPMQWNTCVLHLNQAPILRYTNVMTPLEMDKDHFYELVNKYKPNQLIVSPTKLATFIEPGMKDECDLSSIQMMMLAGSAASPELLKSVEAIAPNIEIKTVLGLTEAAGNILQWGATVHGSVGDPAAHTQYRPNQLIVSPTKLATFIEPGMKDECDLSSIQMMMLAGSAASPELLKSVEAIAPNIEIKTVLGLTEAAGNILQWGATVHGSVGDPAAHTQYRLIDVDTQEDIYEPNITGELWIKGPTVFKGYYKNPVATKEAFSEDGWLKTGDLVYRDELNNFFYMDRIKLMFKYMSHQISPVEIQNVILQHPAVQDVAVTSIPDKCGDLPVACVVRKPGFNVTAQEIKDIVEGRTLEYYTVLAARQRFHPLQPIIPREESIIRQEMSLLVFGENV